MEKSKVKPSPLPWVTLTIRKGSASPAQKEAWHKLWAKLLSEAIKGEGSEAVLPTTSKPMERNLDERLSTRE